MTKIMLVEDDNNLREIYEARLAAEGFDIVAAPDGEAALALAAKERPDLIITDVMMPKISGFEMLDIMRNTENLRDVKVIMLTALGQAEDNARAGALGADRYLVKSQVTLEDIVKATHDVLEGDSQTPEAPLPADFAAAPTEADPQDTPSVAPAVEVVPAVEQPTPVQPEAAYPVQTEKPQPVAAVSDAPDPDLTTLAEVAQDWQSAVPETVASEPAVQSQPAAAPSISIPVIDAQPSDSDDTTTAATDNLMDLPAVQPTEPDLDALSDIAGSAPSTSAQEESAIHEQIEQFLGSVDEPSEPESTEPESDLLPLPQDPPQPPAEQSEAEMQADAAVPDLGEMSVQAEPAPQPVPEPEVSDAAGEPETTADPGQQNSSQPDSPPVTQTPGDQVVSNAIDNMMASSPAAQSYPAPAPAAILPEPVEAAPETQAAAPDAAEMPESSEQPSDGPEASEPDPNAPAPIAHKRVISPIGLPSRPDINQLLAMEEAKTAATQVSNSTQQPAPAKPQPIAQPQPQPASAWQPAQPPVMPLQPAPGQQPTPQPWRMPGQQTQGPTHKYTDSNIDPNSISL